RFHLDSLHVLYQRIGCCFFKSALEISAPYGKQRSYLIYRNSFVYIFLNKLLSLSDMNIIMILLCFENNKRRLAITVNINLESFRTMDGDFPACIFFDKI